MRTPAALLESVRERKLVQWALAYLTGAWLLLQVFGEVRDNAKDQAPRTLAPNPTLGRKKEAPSVACIRSLARAIARKHPPTRCLQPVPFVWTPYPLPGPVQYKDDHSTHCLDLSISGLP